VSIRSWNTTTVKSLAPPDPNPLQAFFVEGKPQNVGSIRLNNGDVKTLKYTRASVSCRARPSWGWAKVLGRTSKPVV
jgi:hypothetical protein